MPDLPHDEAAPLRAACDARGPRARAAGGAHHAAPSASRPIGADARGFVYTVSLAGTTGERADAASRLSRTPSSGVRAATELPVAVGFGIATAEQARAVAELADGVIVGSRVVRAAGEGGAAAVRDARRGARGRSELTAAAR